MPRAWGQARGELCIMYNTCNYFKGDQEGELPVDKRPHLGPGCTN